MVQRKSIGIGSARIADLILEVRGRKVILDSELAALYAVPTKQFNQAIRRNQGRFPAHFCFQLSNQEVAALRSQFVTSNVARGGRRYSPYVFTEHGAIMAATILNTPRAIDVSVFVVSAFVELREALGTHKELSKRLDDLEANLERKLAKHDEAIASILTAIRSLMKPPEIKRRPIGFVPPKEE
jgi:phage regulator Rha-like protein